MTHSPLPTPHSPLLTYPPAQWRLILSSPLDGPTNMAIDEAILSAVSENQSPPTLRFFAWTPPCLSLGYAQPVGDVDRERLRGLGWDLVRRPTGGRAILHTAELTYSVIAPMSEPRVVGGVIESYRQLSAGLMQGVELLGLNVRAEKNPKSSQTPEAERRGQIPNPNLQSPNHPITLSPNPVCFEAASDYEITANGRKLLGSAQVRKQGVVLQHGTLPLTGDVARIVEVLRVDSEKERARLRERVHRRATTVEEVLGRAVTWAEAVAALQQGFAEKLNLSFEERGLTEREVELTAQLRAEKYAAERWNARV